MSSWIPSLFNPNPDPSSDEESNPTSPTTETHSSGVRKDLSAVFRGVTAFLAPPPATPVAETPSSSSTSDAIAGIKNDLAEIQGSFKSGLSLIASKFSNNFLPLGEFDGGDKVEEEEDDDDDDDDDDAVGITEEVVNFARKLSKRPELWIDFPLSLADDFDLSDHQREHAANIDYLVPELMKLRQNIGSQISDGKFWIIYFILLFPRFNEADSELLSTPQVVEARETLLKKLQNKNDSVQNTSQTGNKDTADENVTEEDESTSQNKDASSEIISSRNSLNNIHDTKSKNSVHEEETHALASISAKEQSGKEEDVSFSDLEDDECDLSEKLRGSGVLNNKNGGESGEWIQLHENAGAQGGQRKIDKTATMQDKDSEGGDSSDWLAVDESDFDNLDPV